MLEIIELILLIISLIVLAGVGFIEVTVLDEEVANLKMKYIKKRRNKK